MQLDNLRATLLSERETGRLITIPDDLYDQATIGIEAIMKEVYATDDPFSEEAKFLIELAASCKETLSDLFRIRADKILALAEACADGEGRGREDLKRMVGAEREMYEQITTAIKECRIALLGERRGLQGGHLITGTVVSGSNAACEPPVTERPQQAVMIVRVLSDIEPFFGIDGRTYHLAKEDLATLPWRNAEVLCERNIILNMNPSK